MESKYSYLISEIEVEPDHDGKREMSCIVIKEERIDSGEQHLQPTSWIGHDDLLSIDSIKVEPAVDDPCHPGCSSSANETVTRYLDEISKAGMSRKYHKVNYTKKELYKEQHEQLIESEQKFKDDRIKAPQGEDSVKNKGGSESERCQNLINMRSHTNERPYKCNVCGKTFTKQSYLTSHLRTHTGERPYKCIICEKAFNSQGDLKRHSRTHTGDRPYKCNTCEKTFNRRGVLTIHLRTHTNERPYNCNICQKDFTRTEVLQLHLRTHTGERPYNCEFCKKSFVQKGSLRSHLRTHSGERPYKCDICMKAFTVKRTLLDHLITHSDERTMQLL